MSHTREAARTDANHEHRRRWYHPRPEPRRRSDFMGFNSTWWGMALIWLVVIVLIAFPFPWWW